MLLAVFNNSLTIIGSLLTNGAIILKEGVSYGYRNPNDAVSVFPFNTIMLAVSFVILVAGFMYFHTLLQYAYVYLLIAIFQCCSSVLAWTYFYNKKKKYDL